MTRAYNTATTQQNSGGAVAGVTAGKNVIINGGFDIWQRNTSVALSNSSYVYSADRWEHVRDAYTTGATASRQTASLQGFRYCLRLQRDSGNTSTAAIYADYSIETANALPYCNTTVTVSFYARAGANYSASDNVLSCRLISGTGTDQALKNYTSAAIDGFNDVTLTTSWQRFSFRVTTSASANELGINFRFGPTGTAGANDYFEVTGVQMELGSVATPFSRAGGTIAGELAACQRYYEQSAPAGTVLVDGMSGTVNGVASAYSGSDMRTQRFDFKVTKRVTPTMTYYRSNDGSTAGRWVYYVSSWTTPTGLSNSLLTQDSFAVYMTGSFTTRDCYIIEGGGWSASAEL
jgi:hypothetical protein